MTDDGGLCLDVCKTMIALNFMNCFFILLVVVFSVLNLLRNLSEHLSYEYKRHRMMFILQGLVMVSGLIAGCAFSLQFDEYFELK